MTLSRYLSGLIHTQACDWWDEPDDAKCSCGLDDAIKEVKEYAAEIARLSSERKHWLDLAQGKTTDLASRDRQLEAIEAAYGKEIYDVAYDESEPGE